MTTTKIPTLESWVVFDGEYCIIDSGFDTVDLAEAAATTHRFMTPEDEDYPTMVAYAYRCHCYDGCHFCNDGIVTDNEQPWRH